MLTSGSSSKRTNNCADKCLDAHRHRWGAACNINNFSTLSPHLTLLVWNDGVPVAWEKTDTEILALISATQTSSSTSPSTISSTTPDTSTGTFEVTSPGNSPLQTSTSIAPTAAATSGNPAPGWFSGHQGTVRIVLIVVAAVGSLG
jgi:hypothetical protein